MLNVTRNPNKKAETGLGSSQASLPRVSLPKGGGAIRGIGEKFAANPVTGTGSMSVPIATSPGRSGFGPQLSLSYDSGAGNGPFGFGWSLSLPSITRKTDKGLPKYQDADESDVFVLSGAEDLVPVLIEKNGKWERETLPPRTVDGKEYKIRRYKPRIEGLFARIERWTNQDDPKDTFWRSISRDNITTWYGKTEESRIADPADPSRIFSWLICESYTDKGNAILYEYLPEDSAGIDLSQVHERNRTNESRSANRYLKRIKYGNLPSRLVEPDLSQIKWLFEVVFDYDDGHYEKLSPDPELSEAEQHRYVCANIEGKENELGRAWPVRQDPLSSYRAGFEVRTYRLCHRVLMFHHFPDELGIDDYLVRSTEFTYEQGPIASFIKSVTQSGYGYVEDQEKYLKKSLPSLEFEYRKAVINEDIQEIDAESLENLPYGLDGVRFQWVDLDGEGLSGILTEQSDAWFYKPNLGGGRFGPMEKVALKPSLAALSSGRQQLMDLAGDGQLDLVELSSPVPGFYERTHDQRWNSFKPFAFWPNVPSNDPNLRFVDLTCDGHADILITEDEVLTWYPSMAEQGFGPAVEVYKPYDEEKGPRLVFADGTQSIYLADISGDGLSDLVRIRNGEVCYWPNLGYGCFGSKVTMDNAPWFDAADQFDQQRIRLSDIDGSGVTDIIYLGRDGVHLYFNQSGNSWSDKRTLAQFPHIDNLAAVTVIDLFGNGTACIVWSSPLPGDAREPMRYIDLMGGMKPHLLVGLKNNMGAETRVHYASSTKFYLADKAEGKPWITRLPFPVHVVEQVETYDWISRNRFVTRYAYHHGYFDGIEREFRGFGLVEQKDTEEFAALNTSNAFPSATNIDEASHVPPVLTKTWFHTGAYIEGEAISRQFEEEYWRESDASEGLAGLIDTQLRAMLLEDTILPSEIRIGNGQRQPYTLTAEETREAFRALKGSVLRQEIYALDGTDEEDRPYSVSERNYTLELAQPRYVNKHAVFFSNTRETIDFHYERKLYEIDGNKHFDPRVTHALTLEVDDYGNVLKSITIGYGRRFNDSDPLLTTEDKNKQKRSLITYTENRYTNPILEDDVYRTPLLSETLTYELLKVKPNSNEALINNLFQFDEVAGKVQSVSDGQHDLPYEQWQVDETTLSASSRRLIEHVRTLYRKNNLEHLLPLGELESFALPGESYNLAFTPGLVTQVYGDRVTDAMLAGDGRYVHFAGDTNWWIPSGQMFYSPDEDDMPEQELTFAKEHFFLPRRFRDPFNNSSKVDYDDHDFMIIRTVDPLGNTVQAQNDYRMLQPMLVMDPNRNRTEVAFDALGMVAGTAVMGKPEENLGDSLTNFSPDLTVQQLNDFIADPRGFSANLLKDATTRIIYELDRFKRLSEPPFAATLARETHAPDSLPPDGLKIQVSFSYSDGFGREIQKKIQAEKGPLVDDGTDIDPRWVGSGWTIFNNKGKPVKQYEPFFDDTHDFKFGKKFGLSSTLFYDPVERVVATLHPNHTYEKVVFDPWRQETWDVNDTVLQADPKKDPDVGDFFRRLPDDEYLPTWHVLRTDAAYSAEFAAGYPDATARAQETRAADKTEVHTATPIIAYFDTLGRTFLTLAHNRFEHNGTAFEELYPTRVELDIEGNQRAVRDAIVQNGDQQGRIVMSYNYDMLGNRIHQQSMEAGERWMLNDVAGKLIYRWDSRNHHLRHTYDKLQRSTALFVRYGASNEMLVERTVYGEVHPDSEKLNLRGKVFMQFDGAGVITNQEYDFKGNLFHSTRRLAQEYKQRMDWSSLELLLNIEPPAALDLTTIEISLAPLLGADTFRSSTTYDALNRPVTLTTPDNSVIRPIYNEANLLERIEANLRGAAATTPFVTEIDYNAKGQRKFIEYGNGVKTEYEYDEKTFRLINLKTTRDEDGDLQNLHYTYDPVGNITSIRDGAQQTIYFNNAVIEPNAEYTYDTIYRLIEATGREHIGQNQPSSWNDEFRVHLPHPHDGQAMRRYTEQYEYDEVGNILQLIHQAHNGNWTRTYTYEPGKKNNRLTSTTVGTTIETYNHDAHGNMTSMPHLSQMAWDFEDQLQMVDLSGGGKAYYIYDAAGQRVRKVWEKSLGLLEECIYLGGFEVYREHNGNGNTVTLERETLHIMDETRRIALVETCTQGSDGSPVQLIRYQHDNHLGSACLELDETGNVISYEEYHPYGTTAYQATCRDVEVSQKRYRYTGKERDEESGFYYHGVRYYASWLARWVSCDPAGLVDGINMYNFVRNNPLRYADPKGTQTQEETKEGFAPHVPIIKVTKKGVSIGAPAPYPSGYLWQKEGNPLQLQLNLSWSEQKPEVPALTAAEETTPPGSTNFPSGTPTVVREFLQEVAKPTNVAGQKASGTMQLFTGPEAEKAAEQAIQNAPQRNWSIKNIKGLPTKAFVKAKNLDPGGRLPKYLYYKIWGIASAKVVARAALAGLPVQPRNPVSGSIQAEFELPTLKLFGLLSGSMMYGSGMFSAYYRGKQLPNPVLKTFATVLGVHEATAGMIYGAGALAGHGETMMMGSAMARGFGAAGMLLYNWAQLPGDVWKGDTTALVAHTAGALGALALLLLVLGPPGWLASIPLLQIGLILSAYSLGFDLGRWLGWW
jgi:RHS repeat-associated protein